MHEPGLVVLRVVAPRAAQHDELNLVGDVAHLDQGVQAGGHLQIRVEPVAFGPLAGRLVCQIAFRHAQVVGAVEAVVSAEPGLGDDGDGCHARCRATRLHLQRGDQCALGLFVHIPRTPELLLGVLRVEVVGQQVLFGEVVAVVLEVFVMFVQDAREHLVVHDGAAAYLFDDFKQNSIHSGSVYRIESAG